MDHTELVVELLDNWGISLIFSDTKMNRNLVEILQYLFPNDLERSLKLFDTHNYTFEKTSYRLNDIELITHKFTFFSLKDGINNKCTLPFTYCDCQRFVRILQSKTSGFLCEHLIAAIIILSLESAT